MLDKLRRLAGIAAAETGVELVDLNVKGSSRRRTVRVDIDRAGPRGVDLADCSAVTACLAAAIEAEDLIADSYVLEVSSPGVDRPIRSADDIRRNTGRKIVVTTREPVEGQRSFRGLLQGERDGVLTLTENERIEVRIPLENVETAYQDVGF